MFTKLLEIADVLLTLENYWRSHSSERSLVCSQPLMFSQLWEITDVLTIPGDDRCSHNSGR